MRLAWEVLQCEVSLVVLIRFCSEWNHLPVQMGLRPAAYNMRRRAVEDELMKQRACCAVELDPPDLLSGARSGCRSTGSASTCNADPRRPARTHTHTAPAEAAMGGKLKPSRSQRAGRHDPLEQQIALSDR